METHNIVISREIMTREWFTDAHMTHLFTYLLVAAAHGGYRFDGVGVAPGTTVASFKTIAAETGETYYRVKKCMKMLEAMGELTIVRHKSLAVITISDFARYCPAAGTDKTAAGQPQTEMPHSADNGDIEPAEGGITESVPVATATPGCSRPLSRAERRRRARREAKLARRPSFRPAAVTSRV